MGKTGHTANHDDIVYRFGKLKGRFNHIFGFLEIAGFQQGEFQHPCKMPGFALIGTGKCPGIIAVYQHHTAPDARQRKMQKEIRSDVDTVLLHNAKRSETAKGCGRRHLHGHFFIHRPFHIKILVF